MLTLTEKHAISQIANAITALELAITAATEADYGSQVMQPLDVALSSAQYALATVEGKV